MRVLHHPDAARRTIAAGRPSRSSQEARALAARGVKELLLISQDTTFYGIDRRERGALARLLRELNAVDGLEWIRLLYLYPDDDRRRDAGGDGGVRQGLQVHRPAAAARVEPGAQAHEAARHAPEVRPAARRASARACPASPCARRSSSGSPARPRRDVDELCGVRRATTRSTTSACSPTRTRKARRRYAARRRRAGRGRRRARRSRVMSLQKRLVRSRQRGRIGERVRVLVDGPSADHELVLEGAAGDPGARHRRRRST